MAVFEKKNKKRSLIIAVVGVALLLTLIDGKIKAKNKKNNEANNAQNVSEILSENNEQTVEAPDAIQVFYNGEPIWINGVFPSDKNGKNFYGIALAETFEKFSNNDYLKSLEAVEKSELQFVEIRFGKEKTVLNINRDDRHLYSIYGKMTANGGVGEGLFNFIIIDGEVRRLTDKQMDELGL